MFDAAPPQPPRALQQHPSFAQALRACGQAPRMMDGPRPVLVLYRRLSGILPIAMIPRAHLPGPGKLAGQMPRFGLRRTPILIAPDHPAANLADIGALPIATPASVAEIDLRVPLETRRTELHQKWRNRLAAAESRQQTNTLRVTRQSMPVDPAHWLLRADATQQRRRGYRNWPTALTLAFIRENPGQAQLFTAFQGRAPIAAMLFLRHGRAASYHIGHTTGAGRVASAHTLLLWHATNWLAAKGHHRLDLGLIDTENAPGLARFKLGAGARARSLGGTWLWWPPVGHRLRALAKLDRSLMGTRCSTLDSPARP